MFDEEHEASVAVHVGFMKVLKIHVPFGAKWSRVVRDDEAHRCLRDRCNGTLGHSPVTHTGSAAIAVVDVATEVPWEAGGDELPERESFSGS